MNQHSSPAQTLIQEKQALQQFINVLQEEQSTLISTKVDALPVLLQKKAEIIAEIAKLAESRYNHLIALSLDGSEEGMNFWIATQGNDEDRVSYSELLSQAKVAKELNRLNGLLIGKQMSRNQHALESIQNSMGSGKFYGPDGQSNIRTTGRELGIG